MLFLTDKDIFEKQGTNNAFLIHDIHGLTYWIPRSQVTIKEEKQSDNPLIKNITLLIDIPDWIIKKNFIPVFNSEELTLYR